MRLCYWYYEVILLISRSEIISSKLYLKLSKHLRDINQMSNIITEIFWYRVEHVRILRWRLFSQIFFKGIIFYHSIISFNFIIILWYFVFNCQWQFIFLYDKRKKIRIIIINGNKNNIVLKKNNLSK